MVAEQLRQVDLKASALILEPQGRNTAPAVALAAIRAVESDPDALLLVLPADHVVALRSTCTEHVPLVSDGAQAASNAPMGLLRRPGSSRPTSHQSSSSSPATSTTKGLSARLTMTT